MAFSTHSMNSQPVTDPVVAAVRGFGCPLEPLDLELQQAIVSEYARGYLGLFVGQHRDSLGPVAEELETASENEIPFDTAWDISFGRVRRASQAGPEESPLAVAAAVMRRLQEEPVRSVRLLAPDEAALVEPFDDCPPGCPWSGQQVLARCAESVELLRVHSPRYGAWVENVIRYVLPRDGSDGMMRSASSMDWPGVISASFPCGPAALAEVLVHEASHQHLNIVRRLGPTENGDDHSLYHSPLKGVPRPIQAILVGFHAVANMCLFYRDCLDSRIEDGGYCEANLRRHCEDALCLSAHLQASNGLTEIGRAIADSATRHLAQAWGSYNH
jgi:hypothetical protein